MTSSHTAIATPLPSSVRAARRFALLGTLMLAAGCGSSNGEADGSGGGSNGDCLANCAEAGGDMTTCELACGEGQGGAGGTGASGGTSGTGAAGGTAGTSGAGGTAGTSGAGASGGTGGGTTGLTPTIPPTPSDCPQLATGTVPVMGQQVQLWVGQRREDVKGPILFYWHGTGSVSAEAAVFQGPAIQEIQDMGGMVASFTTSTGMGTTTGNFVWYDGDFAMADYLLGCAVDQLNIDTTRIFTSGCSAGGLQAGSMALGRSSYIAAAAPNSGGQGFVSMWENDYTPAIMTAHGSCSDFVIVYFSNTSRQFCDRVTKERGGFAIDCDHGGGHCGAPGDLSAAQWQFMKDHPYGTTADPYASGLPPSFPSYCTPYPVADIGMLCP